MGSFNVSCSISGLSINIGDKVKLFILERRMKDFLVNSVIVDIESLFSLISFPITGIYNEYGTIEDIEANNEKEHIESIEKFFNKNIYDILKEIRESNSINEKDGYSYMFVLEEVYDKLVDFSIKSNLAINGCVPESLLMENDFREVLEDEQYFIDYRVDKLFRKDKYDVKFSKYGITIVPSKDKEYCVVNKGNGSDIHKAWSKLTNSKTKYTFPRVKDINNLTDEEFKIIENKYRNLTGGSFQRSENAIFIYSIKDFQDKWNELTGEIINVDKYKALTIYDLECENLIDTYKKYLKMGLINPNDKDLETTKLFLNPFLRGLSSNNKNTFFDIYLKDILKCNMYKKDMIKLRAFKTSMSSCNKMFFPSLIGEQYGNTNASKELLVISREIIDKRLKEEI